MGARWCRLISRASPHPECKSSQYPNDDKYPSSDALCAEHNSTSGSHANVLMAHTIESDKLILDRTATTSPYYVRFGLRISNKLCKVVKVYDGDSITLAWRSVSSLNPDGVEYANCRISGVDTPELRSTTGLIKSQAIAARTSLSNLILGEYMLFTTVGRTGLDKYGRPLVNLSAIESMTSPRCYAQLQPYNNDLKCWMLVNCAGCIPYFGGTKPQRSRTTFDAEQKLSYPRPPLPYKI